MSAQYFIETAPWVIYHLPLLGNIQFVLFSGIINNVISDRFVCK